MTAQSAQQVITDAITKELATYDAVTAGVGAATLNFNTKGRVFEALNHETADDIAGTVLAALHRSGFRIVEIEATS